MTDLVDIGFRANTSELQRATRDLDQFEQATKEAALATDKLGRESDETGKAVNRTTQTTTQATARTRGLAEAKSQAAMAAQNYASRLGPIGGLLSAIGPAGLAAAAAIGGLTVAINKSINVANQFDKINAALRVATGSASLAQKEFEFLAENASKLGIDLQSSALQFARFSAAAKGTALEGEAARDIFIGISQASVALGLSSEEASRAFVAIQQSASKGKVSAEELRQQLGEAIPRAVPLLAEAMGISVAALDKMLERGEVGVDKLALLGKAFQDFYGPEAQNMAAQYQGSLARLGNELDLLFNLLGQGAQDSFSPVLDALASVVKLVRVELEEAGKGGLNGALARFIAIAMNPMSSASSAAGRAFARVAGIAKQTTEITGGMNFALNQSAANFLETGETGTDFARVMLGVSNETERTTDNLVEFSGELKNTDNNLVRLIGPIEETGRLFRALESGGVSAMAEVSAEIERQNQIAEIANELIKAGVLNREQAVAAAEAHFERLDRINEARERENRLQEEGRGLLEQANAERIAAITYQLEQSATEEQLNVLRTQGVEAYERLVAEHERARQVQELALQIHKAQGVEMAQAIILAENQVATQEQLTEEYNRQKSVFNQNLTLMDMFRGAAEEAGRAIQRSLGDAFRDVLDGNIKGFRDFFSRVVDIAKNAAAQIAAQFAIMNARSLFSGGGFVGLGSVLSAGASAAGGGGGLGGAGGLLGAAGGFGGIGATLSALNVGATSAIGNAAISAGLGPGVGNALFNAGGIGGLALTGGLGALGGGLLAGALGLNQTGGSIGGGLGAGAAALAGFGPLGLVAGGLLGALGGGILGGKQDKGSLALQTGGSGFTGGISTQSAFGTIGLGRGTADIGGDLAQTLLGAVAQADALVAGALTQEQIAAVRNALQGTGQIVGTGRGNKYFEQAFGKAIADRFLKIFEALGIAAPSGLSGLARADGTAGSATAGDVLGLALPALSQGLGLDAQASGSIVDQLAGASGPSADLLGNIGTELVVGNQIQESNGRTLREIRNAIDSLTDEVRRGGSGALA